MRSRTNIILGKGLSYNKQELSNNMSTMSLIKSLRTLRIFEYALNIQHF